MASPRQSLTGLVAAPHTPMHEDASLNLDAIERQAARLLADGVTGVFICGSTGEGLSLTCTERRQVAERWRTVIGTRSLKLIVHVGHTSVEAARQLATHAREIGADAVSIMAPCYFKPATVDDLLDFCAPVAAACAPLPFYFYDIPELTGVDLSRVEFLQKSDGRLPNLAGLKFTRPDISSLTACLAVANSRFDILFGCDEMLLSALEAGVRGAVGSTYNYCAPLYHQLIAAFQTGDLDTARALQLKSAQLVEVLAEYGVLAAGKALMSLVGVECGPPRPPVRRLTEGQKRELFRRVQALGVLSPAEMLQPR